MARRAAGEGGISKRSDGRFVGSVVVGAGKRKYVYGKSEKEVAKKLREIKTQIDSGTFIEPSKITLSEWLEVWLRDFKQGNIDQNTFESYSENIRLHVAPRIGQIKLSGLHDFHIQGLYRELQEDGARKDKKPGGLSTRSIKYIHTILNGALKRAKKSKLIKDNPCEDLELPRQEKKEPRFLDGDQVTAFLKEAKQCRYYTAFLVDLNTGLRQGELLALTWEDIDMKTGEIQVTKTVEQSGKHGLRIKNHTKNKKNRTVGITKAILEVLTFWKARVDGEKQDLGEAYGDMNLVFPNEIGGITYPRAFARQFDRALKRAGMEGAASVHSLRHSFATLSLQEGADLKSIQEALGHHSASFTLDVYGHVTKKMKRDAEEKIGKLLTACLER